MKVTSLSGTPIIGTRRGIVYTAPGATNLGRARVVPLQPRSNNQNSVALSVAAAAQFWKLIPSIDRDAWSAWYGGTVPGYNAFVKINSNAFTWGSSNLIETPYTVHTPGVIFATLFAEPDGIHTTLAVVTNAAPTPPDECWVRLYINFQQRTLSQRHPAARAVYFGSFRATAASGINLYDVTDLMTKNAGQWWYPSCVDTASRRGCGNVCYANYYVTDRFGMPGGAVLQYPTLDQFAGIEPGQLGPGVCPILTTPPFPWQTAAEFYGVQVATDYPIVQEQPISSGSSNVTSFTCNFPKPLLASGATAFILMSCDGSSTVTIPSGWTLDFNYQQSTYARLILCHRTSNGAASATFTAGVASSWSAMFFELSGAHALDQVAHTTTANTLCSIPPPITPSANSIVFAFSATVRNGTNTLSNLYTMSPLWSVYFATSGAPVGPRTLQGYISRFNTLGTPIQPLPIYNGPEPQFPSGGVVCATFSIL